jgi:D-alanyl-D-alanine carboxypeptidase/D-alanyl-D-alanine-endopeptidase (penicillin-binding protein 4)
VIGVNNNTWSFLDGSGISRHNIITPKTLVTLLKNIYRLRLNDYIACLPVAGPPKIKRHYIVSICTTGFIWSVNPGRSGTLENRFKGTPAEGIVHAKTGTLSGVTALSGYVLRSDYAPVVFSIIVNNSNKPTTYLRSVLDQMVVWLAQLCSC